MSSIAKRLGALQKPDSTNMRHTPILIVIAVALSSSIFESSIAQSQLESTSKPPSHSERKYRILDSRSRAHTFGAGDPQFFWINNDELLFLAIQVSPDASAQNKERINYTVNRWDTRSGTISKGRDFGENSPRLCFYDGQVLYQFRRKDDSPEAYHGKLGGPERAVDARDYSRFCRRVEESPKLPKWTGGREIRWLERINDGFVDFGDSQKWQENTRVRLYRHGAKQEEGIDLPFGRRDIAPRFPYYQFKDAFFVESHYWVHPRPKEIPYPVFWLHRDGRIEKIADVPWGPWRSRASFFVFPVRPGLVLYSHNARNEFDIAYAGLYLFNAGKVERIVAGWVVGTAVSPDGCKLAFTYAPTITRKDNVLQAMNLCVGG